MVDAKVNEKRMKGEADNIDKEQKRVNWWMESNKNVYGFCFF